MCALIRYQPPQNSATTTSLLLHVTEKYFTSVRILTTHFFPSLNSLSFQAL